MVSQSVALGHRGEVRAAVGVYVAGGWHDAAAIFELLAGFKDRAAPPARGEVVASWRRP